MKKYILILFVFVLGFGLFNIIDSKAQVAPSASVTWAPSQIKPGESATETWTVTGADAGSIVGHCYNSDKSFDSTHPVSAGPQSYTFPSILIVGSMTCEVTASANGVTFTSGPQTVTVNTTVAHTPIPTATGGLMCYFTDPPIDQSLLSGFGSYFTGVPNSNYTGTIYNKVYNPATPHQTTPVLPPVDVNLQWKTVVNGNAVGTADGYSATLSTPDGLYPISATLVSPNGSYQTKVDAYANSGSAKYTLTVQKPGTQTTSCSVTVKNGSWAPVVLGNQNLNAGIVPYPAPYPYPDSLPNPIAGGRAAFPPSSTYSLTAGTKTLNAVYNYAPPIKDVTTKPSNQGASGIPTLRTYLGQANQAIYFDVFGVPGPAGRWYLGDDPLHPKAPEQDDLTHSSTYGGNGAMPDLCNAGECGSHKNVGFDIAEDSSTGEARMFDALGNGGINNAVIMSFGAEGSGESFGQVPDLSLDPGFPNGAATSSHPHRYAGIADATESGKYFFYGISQPNTAGISSNVNIVDMTDLSGSAPDLGPFVFLHSSDPGYNAAMDALNQLVDSADRTNFVARSTPLIAAVKKETDRMLATLKLETLPRSGTITWGGVDELEVIQVPGKSNHFLLARSGGQTQPVIHIAEINPDTGKPLRQKATTLGSPYSDPRVGTQGDNIQSATVNGTTYVFMNESQTLISQARYDVNLAAGISSSTDYDIGVFRFDPVTLGLTRLGKMTFQGFNNLHYQWQIISSLTGDAYPMLVTPYAPNPNTRNNSSIKFFPLTRDILVAPSTIMQSALSMTDPSEYHTPTRIGELVVDSWPIQGFLKNEGGKINMYSYRKAYILSGGRVFSDSAREQSPFPVDEYQGNSVDFHGVTSLRVDQIDVTSLIATGVPVANPTPHAPTPPSVQQPPVIVTQSKTAPFAQTRTYTWTTTAPNNGDILWGVNWGDTTVPTWTGICPSNPPKGTGKNWTYTTSHTWDTPGNYTIKVYASDCVNPTTTFTLLEHISGTATQ